jgi:hypothetical protein
LAGESTVGCLFYGADLDSHDSVETRQFAIAVSNVQEDQAAMVTVERKTNGQWNAVGGPQQVDALQLHTFNLDDWHQDDSGVLVGGAYRVTSDTPIIAYQFNPVDGASSLLSDASMLFPVPAWDDFNHVIGWVAMKEHNVTLHGAYVTILASEDGTEVEVTPSVATVAGNGVPAGTPGQPFDIMLDEGDIAEVMAKTENEGLTGTKIKSNHPVGVMSGHECANIPVGTCCCDHMEEQLSGVRLWGDHFIASRMPLRPNAQVDENYWQIYASEDGTSVTINADNEVQGLPNGPINLDQGEMVDFYAYGQNGVFGDFEVTANNPIAVVNYMTGSQHVMPQSQEGDPLMVQMSPVQQYLPRYVVLVPGTWVNDYLIITREAGAEILIDGMAADDNLFDPVANSDYEVARIPIPDGVHVLDGQNSPFQVVVVGFDTYDSYGYLGGTGTGVINPNPED